jgi:hypothetical protein
MCNVLFVMFAVFAMFCKMRRPLLCRSEQMSLMGRGMLFCESGSCITVDNILCESSARVFKSIRDV